MLGDIMLMDEKETISDVELLSHVLLFVYQKAIRDLCILPHEYFTRHILSAVRKISDDMKIILVRGMNLDQAFENYSAILKNSGLVKNIWFEKLNHDEYMLHIEGCIYAKRIHSILKPRNVVCRFALLAMAIYEKFSGNKVELTNSEFMEEGTKTVIKKSV